MENRAKLRFPRTLLSPFASCKAHKLISDVILHHQLRRRRQSEPQIPFSSTSIEPLLPPNPSSPTSSLRKLPSQPSMCKPRCPETLNLMVENSCILSVDRHKIHPSSNDVVRGGWMRCPPVSPVSPLTHNLKQGKQRHKENGRRKKKKRSTRNRLRSSYLDWFSSDDEREEDEDDEKTEPETDSDTPFSSSRSFLSLTSDPDSFGSARTRKPPSARRREARKKKKKRSFKKKGDVATGLEEKVKGSFAVVKSSSDPYNDFRASMVEMIMEKQIYGARELEQLLQCFISLNSPHHHKAIVEVFAEICDALFFSQLGL